MPNIQPTLVPASGSLDIMFARAKRKRKDQDQDNDQGKDQKRDKDQGEEVQVWWGLSVVERLGVDPDSLETKLSAARYYNMGCRPAVLVEHYGFARTTLRRYGDALKSGDPAKFARAFAGQGGPRKVGPEMEYYIRARYEENGVTPTHWT